MTIYNISNFINIKDEIRFCLTTIENESQQSFAKGDGTLGA